MVSQKVVVKNESGLHARPAGVLVQAAKKCGSQVQIIVGEKVIPLKNILKLMAAGIKCGTEIEVQCEGETEEADLKGIVALIESGLGE